MTTPDLNPDDLVALNRLATIARVLAGAAHEVNNALQIIGGSAELIEGQSELSDSSRRAVQRIQAQSARAARAVADVMRFARDRSESPARVPMRDLVVRAAALRAFQIRRAGLVLEFDGAGAPAAVVHGQAPQLELAVVNLIMNAEQALAGRQGGTIQVTLSEEAGHALLGVRDNGPGVDPSLGERVFEPFVGTRPRAEAPGLGLTAARIVARAHGGEVTIQDHDPGCLALLKVPLAGPAP